MRITIQGRGEDPARDQKLRDRLRMVLGRYEDLVGKVHVSVEPNDPSGAGDVHVHVSLPAWAVEARGVAASAEDALARALSRLRVHLETALRASPSARRGGAR